MTWRQYRRNQKDPKRIRVTRAGKKAIREFVGNAIIRHGIDTPTDNDVLGGVVCYFVKWLIDNEVDQYTGKNSIVCVYVKRSDGREHLHHNYMGGKDKEYPGAVAALRAMADDCEEEYSSDSSRNNEE